MSRTLEPTSRLQGVTSALFTGMLAILPLALTLLVLAWIVTFLHDLAGPTSVCGRVLRSIGLSVVACEVAAYGLGLLGAVALVYALGRAIEQGAAGAWSRSLDVALQRIPVLGTVYDASKQITSVFDRKSGGAPSMTPVICSFGDARGAWTPALMPTRELVRLGGDAYHVVVVPTAPVPFGGALLCVKAEWVQPANCGLDDLVGVYMSMGVTAPRCLSDAQPAAQGLARAAN